MTKNKNPNKKSRLLYVGIYMPGHITIGSECFTVLKVFRGIKVPNSH